MVKKIAKILIRTVCIALIGFVIWFMLAFFGNPVSYLLSRLSANRYMNEHFADSTFQIESVNYDLKSGGYHASVSDLESVDSYFTISFDWLGRYQYDTYEAIVNGSNTYARLDQAYGELVDNALNTELLFDISIAFGELTVAGVYEIFTYVNQEGETIHYSLDDDYGLDIQSLILDGEYDIAQLGRDYGCITLYIHDPVLTTERTAELLVAVAKQLDELGVPFHAINFHHCEPRNEEGQNVGGQIDIYHFPYSEIFSDDLLSKVEEYWAITQEHHAIQDGYKYSHELIVPFVIPESN